MFYGLTLSFYCWVGGRRGGVGFGPRSPVCLLFVPSRHTPYTSGPGTHGWALTSDIRVLPGVFDTQCTQEVVRTADKRQSTCV